MNLPVLGDYFLLAAAVCAACSCLVYIRVWRGEERYRGLARKFFLSATLLVTAAIAVLVYLIFVHDFTVAYVHSYSSTDLPWFFLMSSLWGGQEGTFLLWTFYVGVLGMIMMYTSRRFEAGNMVFLNLFVISILLILLKKSPFELMSVFQLEGAGLNPLLQNYWMTIHPPIMFVGFAGTVFPFCFVMTALISRKYDEWAEAARRWTIFAWATLGVSLVMGGYWAYETLGWGGFWAWDPVENSSFIPWIFLTTQVHSLLIKRQRRGLMRFSPFVVCLSFWSVLYGTFLTRSGVLADFSVHSFVDLGINQFLIGGLLFFVALGSSLLLWRWHDIKPQASYSTVNSRSYMVTLGVVLLFIGGCLVLLGTSAPLLTRLTDQPSSVGLPYYFATMTPVAAAIMILLALFPIFRWKGGMSRPRLLIVGVTAAITTMGLLMILGVTFELIYLLFFSAAVWAIVSNSYALFESWRAGRIKFGYVAHIGLAITMIGAGASAGFGDSMTITLPRSVVVNQMGYQLNFVSIEDNSKGFDCHVEIKNGEHEFTAVLPHEFPRNAEGVMKKPHVEKYWTYDLYISPLALEQSDAEDPGLIMLEKGASAELDKYKFTFIEFDVGDHGDNGPRSVTAELTVEYDGRSESLRPVLRVTEDGVEPAGASFDSQRGMIFIAGVRPDDGSVVLQVQGDFVPAADPATASLVIELSEKPLINLFWLGTILVFSSGAMSTRAYRRRKTKNRQALVDASDTPVISKKEAVG